MTKFSPSDAALEGFRLTREHPASILAWSGVYFLGILVMAVVMYVGIGPKFITFMREGGLQSGDAEALGSLLAQSWPAFIIVLLIAVFILAVLTAGIYRLVLRREEKGFAHLRLGPDELRLTAMHLILFAIGMVFLMVLDVVVAAGRTNPGTGSLGAGLAAIALFVAMVWIGVRLSIATPAVFVERKISLSSAWRLSRGKFWNLFGMIVLAIIFYVMIWVLITIIGVVIVQLAGGAEAMQAENMKPGVFLAVLATAVIQLLLPILQVVMIYAPLAFAYKQLAGLGEPELRSGDRFDEYDEEPGL